MSLLTICQNVAQQAGFTAPATIVGNADTTAVRLKALASRTARSLATDFDWSALQREHTFSTVNGTATYSLPSDFDHFISTTGWDRSQFWALQGPMTPQEWQLLKSGIIETFPRMKFRVLPTDGTNEFTVLPTPTSAVNLVYEYVSNKWCRRASDDVLVADWSADGDTAIISEDLIELGLLWRFKNALGLAYAEEKLEFDQELARIMARDGGSRILNQSTPRPPKLNIQEQGYGS